MKKIVIATITTLSLVGVAVPAHSGNVAVHTQAGNQKTAVAPSARIKTSKGKRCKRSRKFNERQVRFGRNARIAGRCITSEKAGRGIKVIWSRQGHHPSAGRALDIMVNRKGSCHSGRKTGDKVARYFMNKSRKFNVQYIIWENKIWNRQTTGKRPLHRWRGMGWRGCTHAHWDHVHLALK